MRVNPKFFRSTEAGEFCGSSEKAKSLLGWAPSKVGMI